MTKKEQFLAEFDKGHAGVNVYVTVPGGPSLERITNSKLNFEAKRRYYAEAYDDDLRLLSFPEIRIVRYDFY